MNILCRSLGRFILCFIIIIIRVRHRTGDPSPAGCTDAVQSAPRTVYMRSGESCPVILGSPSDELYMEVGGHGGFSR